METSVSSQDLFYFKLKFIQFEVHNIIVKTNLNINGCIKTRYIEIEKSKERYWNVTKQKQIKSFYKIMS